MIALHTTMDKRIWNKADKEAEVLEDKGWEGYLLNIVRRIIKKVSNPLKKSGISLTIKIYPTENISVMQLQENINEVLQESKMDLDNFILEHKKYGKFYFDVNVDYSWFEDRFVEVNEEAEEDLGEELALENQAKSLTITLTPKNENHLIEKTEELFYLVSKAFNKLMKNLTSKIKYTGKFILELRFDKNKEQKLRDLEKEINEKINAKIYIRYDKDYDKINIILPYDELNDYKKMKELFKSLQ